MAHHGRVRVENFAVLPQTCHVDLEDDSFLLPIVRGVVGRNAKRLRQRHSRLIYVTLLQDLFLRLLRKFAADNVSLPADIRSAVESADWATAKRLTHTVRGLAGTLSAQAVVDGALALEQSIDAQDSARSRSGYRSKADTARLRL